MPKNQISSQTGQQLSGMQYKWKALLTICTGGILSTIDASITNIAFPTFTEVFNTKLTTVMWVTIGYFLLCTSIMLVVGKIGDLIGRKKIYTLGVGIYSVGLLFCSLSQTIGQLILIRIFQALGAAMMISCGSAIITDAFPDQERGKGLGIFGLSVYLGFIIGPVLGGLLLYWINWRAIFFVRVPIAIMTFFLALFLLKGDRKKSGPINLDYPGIILSSIGTFCFVYGVTLINRLGLRSPLVALLISLGIILIIIFVMIEYRSKYPIVDLTIFRNRAFSIAALSLFLHFASQAPLVLIMPFYLIDALGTSSSMAGVILAFQAITAMIFGPLSGWLSDRFRPLPFMIAGSVIIIVAFFLMLGFEHNTALVTVAGILSLVGAAFGIFQPPNNSAIMGGVPKEHLGTASALIATLRQVGVTVGIAIVGTMYSARTEHYRNDILSGGSPVQDIAVMVISPAFHDVLIYSLVLSFIVTLTCLISLKVS